MDQACGGSNDGSRGIGYKVIAVAVGQVRDEIAQTRQEKVERKENGQIGGRLEIESVRIAGGLVQEEGGKR